MIKRLNSPKFILAKFPIMVNSQKLIPKISRLLELAKVSSLKVTLLFVLFCSDQPEFPHGRVV